MLIVKIPFCGHGYNMPNLGELIDPPEPVRAHLIAIGVAEVYEIKIVPPPREIKKKRKPVKRSALPRAGRVSRKKTARRSKKTVTK